MKPSPRNLAKQMAKLNPKSLNLQGSRGGMPDITPEDVACALGLAHGDVNLCTLQRMLEAGLEAAIPIALPTPKPESLVFARSPEELAATIAGGAAWN